MARHLGDLLAALMLLRYNQSDSSNAESANQSNSPKAESSNQSKQMTETAQSSSSAAVVNQSKASLCFGEELESVISRSYPPLIVRELLILQSVAGAKVGML